MNPKTFRAIFEALHNMDRWVLEESNLISDGRFGDDRWKRFNSNLTTFVLKLSDSDLETLLDLVEQDIEAQS
jgi:hypothetical protein